MYISLHILEEFKYIFIFERDIYIHHKLPHVTPNISSLLG